MLSITLDVANKVYQDSNLGSILFAVSIIIVSSFIFLNHSAEAQELICDTRAIEQITDEPEGVSDDTSINADGTRIAFESDANINGVNPGGFDQILLFDITTRLTTQITNGTNHSRDPSINADGTLIAFESRADINGVNNGGNNEVYIFDTTSGLFTQVTNEPEGDSDDAAISANGLWVAFESEANINGGNPDAVTQIYLFDITTGTITQITDFPEENQNPSINGDGTRIAFASDANINGGNPEVNTEIYLFDTTTGLFTQITKYPSGESFSPEISADGTIIAFDSNADINGGNPSGSTEVYFFDTTTGITTQATSNPFDGESFASSISLDGTRIGIMSDADINGGNPEGNTEAYVFDIRTGIITQITDEPSGESRRPRLNEDGTRISFESTANIRGRNPEGNFEVFLAFCLDPATGRSIPTLSEWGLIAMAGLLGLIGFIVLRRKKALA